MALTVTTDLVQITGADSLTNWTQIGGTDTAETDYFIQNTGCISLAYNSASERGSTFDYVAAGGTAINFSSGGNAGKLVYIWMRCAVPANIGTRASGAMKILIGSGAIAPTLAAGVWSAWYVDGNDTIQGTDGWKCYVIDPRKTASQTFGGGVDLTATRHFGGLMTVATGLKGNPFGIDQIMYGFGELRARGTNTVEGGGFKEMSDADFGTTANRYGIMVEKEGVFYVQGRLVLGDSVSTNPTTFTSQNESLVWNYPTYYDGTREAPCIADTRDDGTPYFGITVVGNTTTPAGDTSVTFGAKVGTGDTASGRNGPTLIGSRLKTSLDGDDGNVETLKIYGTTFNRFRGGIDLTTSIASVTQTEFIGNSVIGSGSLIASTFKLRANSFIDNLGGTYKTFEDFVNSRATGAETLAVADPRYIWGNTTGGTQLSIPSASAGYVEVLDPGAGDVRNVTIIEADVVGSDNHYAEAVIRWPSAGANQSALGVIIRKDATLATENYWYLKADLRNSLLSLISCATGTDTTVTSSAVTFAEDTDYLLHLYGSGTTLEGFCSGNGATTKLSTTSSTYQTNRRVGIRADAEADQTGDAPRLSRFGAGPITDPKGVIVVASASDDTSYNSYINNARAYDLTTTGTYDFSNDSLSGNMVELRNDSAGSATVNITDGTSPVAIENVGAATTSVVASIDIDITVQDENTDPIQGAQVYIQKSAAGEQWNYTSFSGNSAGDADFVVTGAIDTDLPQGGWLFIWHASDNTKQNYRYTSYAISTNTTFTFPAEVTGTADSGGSTTTLIDAAANFTSTVQEGDTIRNTTDTAWAIVDEVVSATELLTSALSGGNSWNAGDTYSLNKLAITYDATTDLVDIPIFNGQTDAGGAISTTYAGTTLAIFIRVRSNQGTPKYIPFQTPASISGNFTLTVTLSEDTVAA